MTATFDPDTVPDAHGGSEFRLQFVFSEEIDGIEYAWVRDVLASATGGAVTNAGRAAPPSNAAWALVVRPTSRETATTVTLVAGAALPDGRTLTAGDAVTVAGQRGVSAAFDADTLPTEHDGSTAFAVLLAFSEEVAGIGYSWVRDTLVSAGNGTVSNARRADPPANRGWELEVEPAGAADVTLTVVDGLELPDGRTLAGGDAVTVRGPQPQETTVDGPLVMLTWSHPRDGFGAPSGSDYAVRVDGAARTVSAATLEGRTVRLQLSTPVLPGDVVTVAYVGSAMHPLADLGGRLRSMPWDGVEAENVTGLVRTVAVRAYVAGARPVDPIGVAKKDAVVLDAAGLGLSDVAGLTRLTALERLDLSSNAVSDLAPLAGLGALRDLDLSGNRVSDLWPLAGLDGLERLDLSGNRVTDAGPLAGLPRLTVLVLDGNAVTDLWPLAQLGDLEHLGLAGNRVADVTALQDLAALRRLDLGGNPVRELSPLGDVRTLVWLTLPGERLDSYAGTLGRLTRLRWVGSRTPQQKTLKRRSD